MPTNKKYDCLKLQNQLCFPLYAASREVVKRYSPYLNKLDLTYASATPPIWGTAEIRPPGPPLCPRTAPMDTAWG